MTQPRLGVAGALAEPLAPLLNRAPSSWRSVINAWRDTAQARSLIGFVDERVGAGGVVYPADVLRALELTPLPEVRVVVLGQDPYHGEAQAHGLAFSVPEGVRPPPSLRNIFAELQRETGALRQCADLSSWARQGVLLLNTTLTVEDGQAASHAGHGWEGLTERLLQAVAQRPDPCAYLLWGAHAQRLEPLVHAALPPDSEPLILKSNHPSPLAARRPPRPFIGNDHFSEVNRYLQSRGGPIDWVG